MYHRRQAEGESSAIARALSRKPGRRPKRPQFRADRTPLLDAELKPHGVPDYDGWELMARVRRSAASRQNIDCTWGPPPVPLTMIGQVPCGSVDLPSSRHIAACTLIPKEDPHQMAPLIWSVVIEIVSASMNTVEVSNELHLPRLEAELDPERRFAQQ